MRSLFLALVLICSLGNTDDSPSNDAIQALVDKGRNAEAFELAKTAANNGDIRDEARAREWLGWFYDEGAGVEADPEKAAYYFRLAAGAGQNYSRWRLGVMIDKGQASGSLEEAVELFKLAADEDFTNAMVSLAVMNATGRGTPQDYEAALNNYMRAAQAGNPHGIQGVGILFALGEGVPEDTAEASAWFLASASLGNEAGNANFQQITDGMSDAQLNATTERANAIAADLGYDVEIERAPNAPQKSRGS